MADELEKPSFGNFGIENTMDMGTGSAELLKDLMSPETQTSNPDELTPIIAEVPEPIPPVKPKVTRGKEIVQVDEGNEPTEQDVLKNFLGSDENDDTPETPETPIQEVEPPVEDPEISQFTALSKDLYKLGVFTIEEGEEELPVANAEDFLQRFNEEKRKGAIEMVDKFIGQFGEDYQNAFEAIFVKGANPKDYFGVYNNIVSFAQLNLEGEANEANQIAVIKQALTDQGFEPDDITTEIERLKNYGDLESVATKHHKVLVKKEAQKLAQIEAQAETDLQQKNFIKTQYIQNVQTILQDKLKTKEFDGIPINPKLVNELQDFLLVDKYRLPSGELLTEFDRAILDMKRPENHPLKVKVALLLKILEKDPTLSTIQKTGISKQANQLFTEVARQKSKTTVTSPTQPRSWFS